MANLAEFETAPAGTVRRNSSDASWIPASVGDVLGDGNESNNLHGDGYQVRLYPNAGMMFNIPTTVSLTNLQGQVKYQPPGSDWVDASDPGQYLVMGVGTGVGGGVSVVCGCIGAYRPRPWN